MLNYLYLHMRSLYRFRIYFNKTKSACLLAGLLLACDLFASPSNEEIKCYIREEIIKNDSGTENIVQNMGLTKSYVRKLIHFLMEKKLLEQNHDSEINENPTQKNYANLLQKLFSVLQHTEKLDAALECMSRNKIFADLVETIKQEITVALKVQTVSPCAICTTKQDMDVIKESLQGPADAFFTSLREDTADWPVIGLAWHSVNGGPEELSELLKKSTHSDRVSYFTEIRQQASARSSTLTSDLMIKLYQLTREGKYNSFRHAVTTTVNTTLGLHNARANIIHFPCFEFPTPSLHRNFDQIITDFFLRNAGRFENDYFINFQSVLTELEVSPIPTGSPLSLGELINHIHTAGYPDSKIKFRVLLKILSEHHDEETGMPSAKAYRHGLTGVELKSKVVSVMSEYGKMDEIVCALLLTDGRINPGITAL